MIACLEEIAFNKGYISKADLENLSKEVSGDYRDYLLSLIKNRT